MTKFFSRTLLQSAAVAALIPSAALAELSALDVWDSWKSLSEAVGQTITVGSQDASGGALILNDVQMSMEFPDGSAVSTLKVLEFRERSDGTVAITMAPELPFSMTIDPGEGEAVDFALIFRQSGTSIIASGDPDNISFDFLSAEFSIEVDKVVADGEAVDIDVQISMQDIDGNYTLVSEASKSYSSALTAAKTTYTVAFTDPDTGEQFAMKGTILDLATNSDVVIPDGVDLTNPAELFGGGFDVQGGISALSTKASVQADDGDGNFSMDSSSGPSTLDFSVGNGRIQYGGSATDVNYAFSSPQIPFPEVTLGFAEVAFNLLMPLAPADEPQDFGLLVKLGGLEISDMIWGMFDPGQVMPRDPATIAVDVSGTMNWLVEIMDPSISDEFDGETPAELYSLTLNDLTVSAVGAEVTGSGDFTFDNTDLETFDGMPAPTGSVNMTIVGVNGVMDRLIQMGFLQQDQAMGARMMLGLFARPGGGEDTLTSEIEIKGDGSVFANGQQLR